jgi:hypothetical protein
MQPACSLGDAEQAEQTRKSVAKPQRRRVQAGIEPRTGDKG